MDATELREAMRTSVIVPSSIVESVLAEKDAEIERLRQEREELARELNDAEASLGDNALRRALAVRTDIERIARADERKRTAERVKDQVHAHMSTLSLVRVTYLDVACICDEVGGSE